jgi:hypothetical protein
MSESNLRAAQGARAAWRAKSSPQRSAAHTPLQVASVRGRALGKRLRYLSGRIDSRTSGVSDSRMESCAGRDAGRHTTQLSVRRATHTQHSCAGCTAARHTTQLSVRRATHTHTQLRAPRVIHTAAQGAQRRDTHVRARSATHTAAQHTQHSQRAQRRTRTRAQL